MKRSNFKPNKHTTLYRRQNDVIAGISCQNVSKLRVLNLSNLLASTQKKNFSTHYIRVNPQDESFAFSNFLIVQIRSHVAWWNPLRAVPLGGKTQFWYFSFSIVDILFFFSDILNRFSPLMLMTGFFLFS